jgi:hypothetical protein
VRHTEAEVVAALVAEFAQFQIRYAFVNVIADSPLILFEDSPDQDRKPLGFFVPDRIAAFLNQ